MIGFNGGLIGANREFATNQSLPGVWSSQEQVKARRNLSWPSTGGDPSFANVSLLLHGDSTPLVDSSQLPKTLAINGNAVYSTVLKQFGNGSILFGGSGDLRVSSNVAFGFATGDFTVEFWLNYQGGNGYVFFFIMNQGSGNYVGYGLQSDTKTPWVWNEGDVLVGNTSISNNVWQHHAVVRNGSNLRIYLNGISIGSTAWAVDLGAARPLCIGSNGSLGQTTNGFIDDFRITKGVARYTANFTPPDAPFPDF